MTGREKEARLLALCRRAAAGESEAATAGEADLFRLAAQLVRSWHPEQADKLDLASRTFFQKLDGRQASRFDEMVRSGQVRDIPRLRSMLLHQLKTSHGRSD
jgi:hypothetical protein